MDISTFYQRATAIFEEKNRLYGRGNVTIDNVLTRLSDKLARLHSLTTQHGGTDGSLLDACLDIANYVYILSSLHAGTWSGGLDRTKANHVGDGISPPQKLGDVGFDLRALKEGSISPGEIGRIETGVRLLCPRGTWYSIKPRSSVSANGLLIFDNVIDTEYTGPLVVNYFNASATAYCYAAGDRIAQAVFYQAVTPDLCRVESFPATSRGDAGYGSTGK